MAHGLNDPTRDKMFSVHEVPWHHYETGQTGASVVLKDYPQDWPSARKLAGLDWDPRIVAQAKLVGPVLKDGSLAPTWIDKPGEDGKPIFVNGDGVQVQVNDDGFILVTDGKGRPVMLEDGKTQQISDQKGKNVRIQNPDLQWEAQDGWGTVERSDNGDTLFSVRDSMALITNSELGEIVETVIGTGANIKWETGGCLEGGRLVWVLIRMDEPFTIPGDKNTTTLPYMAIQNRHDGWGACVLRSTAIRIVCANTWRAAEMMGEASGSDFKFVHRGSWRDRIEEAKLAVEISRQGFANYVQISKDLLKVRVTTEQTELFVREFIPTPSDGIISDRVARNIEASRQAVRDILKSPTTQGVAHTAYGLVQAAGEYADHVRTSRTWESKLNRTLLLAEPLKVKATKLARECAIADVTATALKATALPPADAKIGDENKTATAALN